MYKIYLAFIFVKFLSNNRYLFPSSLNLSYERLEKDNVVGSGKHAGYCVFLK